MFDYIRDLWRGSVSLGGAARSSAWDTTRTKFKKLNPLCEVCGNKNPEIHHVVPYNVDPSKENDFSNLISLCRDHHFFVAHLMSWRSWNENVKIDSETWKQKILRRP